MTPNLAFIYNSQNGSGIMGKGWSMSGFSSIRRVNQELYYDGNVQFLDFGDEDGFMLDGQRLIKVSTHGNGDIEYRTEIDRIAKVIYDPNGDVNSLDFWKVFYKNGRVRYYGYNEDSRQYNNESYSGADYPLVWHVSKECQAGFNYVPINQNKQFYQIDYYYEQDTEYGECHPLRVEYNINKKNTSNDPDYIVSFTYDNYAPENRRTAYYKFSRLNYINDFRVSNTRRLREIEISFSEMQKSPLKKYKLYYDYNPLLNEPYLGSIKLQSRGPSVGLKELNSTFFDWHFYSPSYNVNEMIVHPNFPIDATNSVRTVSLDINGDGKDEIAEYFIIENSQGNLHKLYIRGLGNSILVESNTDDIVKLLTRSDFNNDGKDELIVMHDHSLSIYFFNEINGVWSTESNPYINSDITGLNSQLYANDINGDGLNDLIGVQNNGSYVSILLGSGNKSDLFTNDNNEAAVTLSLVGSNYVANVSDYNGDGTVELLSQSTGSPQNTRFEIWDLNWDFGTQTGVFSNGGSFMPFSNGVEDDIYFGDFNGDGKSDLLRIHNNSLYYLYPSYGTNFIETITPITQIGLGNNIPIVMDMNKDGRSDLVIIKKNNDNSIEFKIGFSKPDGLHFVFQTIGEYDLLNLDEYTDLYEVSKTFADLNGNGIMCPVLGLRCLEADKKGTAIPQDYFLALVSLESQGYYSGDLITEITNGLGLATHIEYAPFSNTYTNDEPVFPLGKYKSNQAIVAEHYIVYEKKLKLNHKKYSFSNPVMHKQGKGFLGFLNSKIMNYQNNTMLSKKLEVFSDNGLYYYPYLKETKTSILSSKSSFGSISGNKVQLLSWIQNNFTIKNTISGNDIVFYPINTDNLVRSWDANGYLIGTTKSIIDPINVDAYGNTKKHTQLFSEAMLGMPSGEGDYSFKTQVEYDFNYNLTHWLVNRVDVKKVVKKDLQLNEEDAISTFYTYYSESNVAWPFVKNIYSVPNSNTSFAVSKEIEYDKYGNQIKQTILANGETPRITNFKYSDEYHGRFLTASWSELNNINYKVSYTYYEEYGLLKSLVENPDYPSNKRTTEYFYDAFWNNILTKLPGDLYQKNITAFQGQGKLPVESKNALFGIHSYIYSTGNENNQAYWMRQQSALFDKFQRNVQKITWDQNNNIIISSNQYDENGRLKITENPHFASETNSLTTNYKYDLLGRLEEINAPSTSIKNDFNGLSQTVTNLNTGISKTTLKNIIGQVKQVSDNTGDIKYSYYCSGNLKNTNVNGLISSYTYNDANLLIEQLDPDLGTISYAYNKYGELIEQIDDKGTSVIIDYDDLGRIEEKNITGAYPETIAYTYQENPAIYGLGLLKKQEVMDVNSYSYAYDQLNRLLEKTENIDGTDYTHQYAYDSQSQQLKSLEFPSGYSVNYQYRTNGSFRRILDGKEGLVLWESVANNGMGQLTDFNLGNGLSTHKSYDQYGYLSGIGTDNMVQQLYYQFDPSSGNLVSRRDLRNGYVNTEEFTYDENETNNRLMSWKVNGNQVFNMDYENNGNIITKSDITDEDESMSVYQYGVGAGEHAVTQINNPKSDYLLEASEPQSALYNGFNKIVELSKTVAAKHGSSYSYSLEFQYGADQSRKRSKLYRDNLLLKTKYFIGGDYEEEVHSNGNIRKLHYLSAADGIFAIYVKNTLTSDSMYYIHKDHQGNMETITNESGVVLQKLSFDPWGRRRNPTGWSYNTSGLASEIFDRGYTMHEHLDLFGIINMNGRLYDPWVGRMLSPDPFLQNPSNLQNYNRYTYALNNPLKYVDPSGYLHNIYKPQGWDTNAGSGSGMFNYFTSGLDNRYNFDSYNDAVNDAAGYGDQNGTYEYRNGTYYSGTREVSFSDVFSNFVEPNSLALPSNTDLSSITATEEGVSYFTIDPFPSPLKSSFAKEVNLHFGRFGSAGGGDKITMFMQTIPDLNDDQVIALTTWSGALGGITALAYAESGPVGVFVNGVLSVPATIISIRTTADAWRDYSCIGNPSKGDFARVWSNTGLTIGSLIFWPLAIPAVIIQVQDINGNYNDYWNSFNDN